jgi:putative flippase GtrA
MFKFKGLRYILTGSWNTLFGYFSALIIYDYCHFFLHILLIGLITNILNISMSFFTYKYFVFKTKNHWLTEYLKAYIVYGGITILSIGILWFTVDYLKIHFWIAQAVVMVIGVLVSYFGHDQFTFKNKLHE